MWGIDCASPNSENAFLIQRKIVFLKRIFSDHFHFKNQFFLNQESIFRVWECSQSIPRIKLSPMESFLRNKIVRF